MSFSLKRRLLCAGLLALAAFAIPAKSQAGTLEDVKKKGVIVVGIQGDNAPWGYVDSKGVQQGFDSSMGELFAQYLGVKVEFVPLAVANRIPALTTGRVDILFATMGMYPDRAKAVQFSKPYATNDIVLDAPKGTPIKTMEDLSKYTVGVARASAQDTTITKAAPASTNIRRFDDDASTIQAMLSGQIDAIGGNQFYILRLEEGKPGAFEHKLRFFRQYNGASTRLGEKEWNATVNTFIDQIKGTGDLEKVYQKWMGFAAPTEWPASMDGIPYTVQ